MKIKNIPQQERPRERFMEVGAANLSDHELLSILLKTGTKNKSATDISYEILNKISNISDLKDINYHKLLSIKGIGKVKAIELATAIELGKRIFLSGNRKNKQKFSNAESIYLNNKYLFIDKKQEYFYCFYFNNNQELIERKLLFMGTINRSSVHPREVFKEAYLRSASSIVCIHNHPSGNTNPSREDIKFTRTLKEIGDTFGIPVIDHIIVGDDGYYSFYEESDIFLC
ncbi:MAG: DNA repair protein RadC [Bacilli bacterium]|nr:DNA repair protein RadC [Bacilli bacterium]